MCNSVVEYIVANDAVVSSNLITRSKYEEGCPSGLWCSLGKAVWLVATAGSNPAPSAIFAVYFYALYRNYN